MIICRTGRKHLHKDVDGHDDINENVIMSKEREDNNFINC